MYVKSVIFSVLLVCLYSCENKDIKMVKGSLESDPQNFYMLSKDLQTNKEIALLAIEKSPEIYKDIDTILKEDESFVKQAVQRNLMVYHLLSKQLKNNHDIFHLYKNKALSMLNDDQTLFEKLDPKLYDDLEVATIAMKYDNRRYLKLSDRLKKDDQMIKMYMNIPMIFIKGGSFIMRNGDGHNHEKLENKLTIEDFYMSKTEITTEQYMKCVDANICSKPHWDDGKCYMWDKSGGWVRDVLDVKFREENKPIVCVDWRQARTFAKWVGGHLPSEAQWEYASRSEGKDIKYPWGNTAPMCDIVNSHYDCHETTTPVCSKIEGNTIQGLCDMGGNVWEWMLEYENVIISRGGGWGDISSYLQSTLHYSDFNFNSNLHGFRIADTSPLMP